MAIVQISKIQNRSGNLVDLPQLSEAEFGWASDEKRLFIGKETPNENIEVLTSYSRIDFNQLEGSFGNLNISNTAVDGQVLAYDGNNWVNKGGSAGGLITLGDVSNVKITGGAIGYVLQTDGLGNLSWTPKGTLYANILALSDDNPVVMTVANTTPYSNDMQVTISGVVGANADAIVNGQTFYVQLSVDFPTSGNVTLYESAGAINPLDGTGLEYDNSPNAIATTTLSSGTGGIAGGTNTTVQFNNSGLSSGDADFTFDFGAVTKVLSVTGNINASNLNATSTVTGSRLISNIATGTSPLLVTSTTVVANLNADRVDGFDTSVASSANTIVVRNLNGNIAGNTIVGNTISGNLSGTLVATSSAQPNVTSLGTLVDLNVNGNIVAANITANTGAFTGSGSGLSAINASNISVGVLPAGRLSGTYSISITGSAGTATTAGTVTTAAQPNITSVGTLASLAVTGNITSANVTTTSHVIRSVGLSLSAAGTVQGDATVLTKDINIVTTVSAGQGVRLPVAVAGMVIIVNNTSATELNVYPSSGATINTLTTNEAYIHIPAASLQYYAVSATQWYTVSATYS
jgi:hypothetical protein